MLLSLDLGKMADPGKRPDKDYAISWVRQYDKFATGDLQGEAGPSAP